MSSARRKANDPPRLKGLYKVLPYLWIGDVNMASNARELKARRITHIINCLSEDFENEFESDDEDDEGDLNPKDKKKKPYRPTYTNIPLEEDVEMNIEPYFDEVYDVIKFFRDKYSDAVKKEKLEGVVIKKECCLIHCRDSKTISPSFVLAYMLKSACELGKRMELQAAYKYIGNFEPGLNPNDSCLSQLIELEKELFEGQVTMRVASLRKHVSKRRQGKGRQGKGRRGK